MTRRFRENETGVNRSVRILATVGFAVLAAAGIATLVEVRGLLDRPHSVLLDLSAAETDQCVVERDEMTSSGSDAKLVWNVFSDDGIRLDVRVDAGEGTFLDAFWGTPDQPSFSPARCIRTPLSAGHNRLALPIRGKIRRLRLDFGNAPDQSFRISSIRARSGLRLARPWSWSAFLLRSSILSVPLLLLLLSAALSADLVWSFVDRNRFALAAAILVFAVVFELNGSSIAVWNRHVPNLSAEPPLFGIERTIRSDEYAVFTPMTLAQSFAKPAWPYFNDIPRAAPTDMFSVYAQPVRHPLLVFRPFLAGHVLFGFERGLAFFWFGRWLALLLVVYELLKLLTNGNKPLSGVGATLVVLAPVVQWWGAINALAEILVFGALFAICLDSFMKGVSLRERWIAILGLGYSGTCYVMALYPAAMVPFAYVFAAISIWIVIRRAKGFRVDSRSLLLGLLVAMTAVGCLVWYLGLSSESFRIVSGTVYPGRRFDCGGGFRKGFGLSFGNLFFPWTSSAVEDGNTFNRAMFLDFFPLGVALSCYVLIRRRIRDALVILLLLVSVILGAYCVAGFPSWLAGCTLLSRSKAPRAFVALSFVQFLLIVRCSALIHSSFSLRRAIVSALSFSCIASLLAHFAYPNYLSPLRLVLVWAIGFAGSFLLLRFHEHRIPACLFFILLALAAGGTVNPVQCGDAGVLDSDLARAIRSIVEKDNGAWIVEGESFPMNQYPLLVGAPTINAGNLYPAMKRWLDQNLPESAKSVWNRYAVGVRFDIRPGQTTSIFQTGFDTFRVECSPKLLKTLGVHHVLSRRNLDVSSGASVRFIPEAAADGWTVYSVSAVE